MTRGSTRLEGLSISVGGSIAVVSRDMGFNGIFATRDLIAPSAIRALNCD
jgi:hypothetical protein